MEFLDIQGYPTEFKEANINDLVLYIIGVILSNYKLRIKPNRDINIEREREIISKDNLMDGIGKFVLVDMISIEGSEDNYVSKYVVVIEYKLPFYGAAKQQCMLEMKDMRECNGGGEMYGFVTTGEDWQMIKYDGRAFTQTEKFAVLFRGMVDEEEKWMKDYSAVVDCMAVVLLNGGIVEVEDVVVG